MHKWKGPKIHLQSPCYSRHTSMSCWYKLPASRGTPSWPYRPASSASHPDILPLASPRSCACQYGGWWSREAGGQLVVAASVSSSTSLLEPGSESQEERRGLGGRVATAPTMRPTQAWDDVFEKDQARTLSTFIVTVSKHIFL